MASNYEFVRYQPGFKRQVVELQSHLWSPSFALNTAYFEWKYERNPYLQEPPIHLVVNDGEIVGMRGFFGVQWEGGVPAQRFINLYADDLVIAPAHRKHGLVKRLMSAALDSLADQNCEYLFNLSAGDITLASSLSMGWRSAGWAHPTRRRSLRLALQNRVLQGMQRLHVAPTNSPGAGIWRSISSPSSLADADLMQINQDLRYVPAISFSDTPRCAEMAELVERIGTNGRIRHVRDSEYFQWRFQNPLSRYRYLYWMEDRLQGYLVLQEYISEYADKSSLNIVDWEASSLRIQAELLGAAVAAFAKTRDMMIWAATLSHPVIALLRKNGFRTLERPAGTVCTPPAILVYSMAPSHLDGEWTLAGLPLLDMASWDLRMLYSMRG